MGRIIYFGLASVVGIVPEESLPISPCEFIWIWKTAEEHTKMWKKSLTAQMKASVLHIEFFMFCEQEK